MNRIFLSLIVLMIVTGLYAQPGARREMIQDRVEAQRVAFITQKLELTPDEAAKFWPLHNEYKIKQQKLRSSAILDRIDQQIEQGGHHQLSNVEAEKAIEEQFALEENLLRLKREYYGQFRNAIPSQKIARLSAVEMQFNRTVLEHIRDKMQNR